MFKFVIFFVALAAIATAFPDGSAEEKPVAILKSERQQENDGSFSFTYETGDGSARQETGKVVNAGTDEEAIEVSGSYSYTDANGELVKVTYTAGKDGFIPVGTNIPNAISEAAKAQPSDASEK